jgi:hypothetical protein
MQEDEGGVKRRREEIRNHEIDNYTQQFQSMWNGAVKGGGGGAGGGGGEENDPISYSGQQEDDLVAHTTKLQDAALRKQQIVNNNQPNGIGMVPTDWTTLQNINNEIEELTSELPTRVINATDDKSVRDARFSGSLYSSISTNVVRMKKWMRKVKGYPENPSASFAGIPEIPMRKQQILRGDTELIKAASQDDLLKHPLVNLEEDETKPALWVLPTTYASSNEDILEKHSFPIIQGSAIPPDPLPGIITKWQRNNMFNVYSFKKNEVLTPLLSVWETNPEPNVDRAELRRAPDDLAIKNFLLQCCTLLDKMSRSVISNEITSTTPSPPTTKIISTEDAFTGLEISRVGLNVWSGYLDTLSHFGILDYSTFWRSPEELLSGVHVENEVAVKSREILRKLSLIRSVLETWANEIKGYFIHSEDKAQNKDDLQRKLAERTPAKEFLEIKNVITKVYPLVYNGRVFPEQNPSNAELENAYKINQVLFGIMDKISKEVLSRWDETATVIKQYVTIEEKNVFYTQEITNLRKENARLKEKIKALGGEGGNRIDTSSAAGQMGGGGGGTPMGDSSTKISRETLAILDAMIKLRVSHVLRSNRIYKFAEAVSGALQHQRSAILLKIDVEELLIQKVRQTILTTAATKFKSVFVPNEALVQAKVADVYLNFNTYLPDITNPGMMSSTEDTLTSIYKTTLISGKDLAYRCVKDMFPPSKPPISFLKLIENDSLLQLFAILTARYISYSDDVNKKTPTTHISRQIIERSIIEANLNLREELIKQKYSILSYQQQQQQW